MKQDASFFEGKDADLVYIAKRLSDAIEVERVFTAAGVDFGVETDTYQGGIVFRSERVGAFFYVLPEDGSEARRVLRDTGFKPQKPLEEEAAS